MWVKYGWKCWPHRACLVVLEAIDQPEPVCRIILRPRPQNTGDRTEEVQCRARPHQGKLCNHAGQVLSTYRIRASSPGRMEQPQHQVVVAAANPAAGCATIGSCPTLLQQEPPRGRPGGRRGRPVAMSSSMKAKTCTHTASWWDCGIDLSMLGSGIG